MKTLAVAALAATLALSGCTTLQNARARIVRAPSTCVDQTVQVYFDPQSAELTPEGQAVINSAAASLRSCRVTAIDVLGLADAVGAPQANYELSQRRAQAVSHALAASGLPTAEFHIAAAGQAGARTSDGQAAPLRRRVDVMLHVRR
ncbi:OmpA family protein [Phenylobacterium sp. LjRoot225]|uniref:OmpA family protein n=1 Tax=Phenylobacterium sp. LjRoot225 TaxID=3342285 RepID=UPI003ECF9BC7